MSQEELAYRAKLSVRHVGAIERGAAAPRVTTLLRIARALDVAPSDLVKHVDER